MRLFDKNREVQETKNRCKSLYILLGTEAFCVLFILITFFFPHGEYDFSSDIYFSDTTNPSGSIMESSCFSLPAGSYQISVYYKSDSDFSNTCSIKSLKLDEMSLKTNGAQLFHGLNELQFDVWLYRKSDDLRLIAQYKGPGDLEINGFHIVETNAFRGMALFFVLLISMLIDAVYIYRGKSFSKEDKLVHVFLLITIIFTAYPLFEDFMPEGGDLIYHLERVEGIKDSLQNGVFPVRISPEWIQGYGYASPIFYGETLLYPAGILRLMGFDVTSSFRIFMFMVSVATVLIAYYGFFGILKSRHAGIVSTFLYCTSIYRNYKVYCTESWGEMFGIMLLPLILYGFYGCLTFTENGGPKEKYGDAKYVYLPLAIGLALLVQSHLLTGELAGFFIILTCILFWKKIIEPKRFWMLAKAAMIAILLSAWFLVPFFDYMLNGNFVIQNVSARTIQSNGLLPAHLLTLFVRQGKNVFYDQTGMYLTSAVGVGGVLTMILIYFLYTWFFRKKEGLSDEEWIAAKIMSIYAILSMLMSLSLFPWDRIQACGKIAATLVSSIQFPNRFLTISNVMLCALAGMVAKHVAIFEKEKRRIYTCLIVVMVISCNLYFLEDIMENGRGIRVYNSEGMGTGYISGAEYLPYGAEPSLFVPHDPVANGDVTIENYEKKPLGAFVQVQNRENTEINLSFPLLYYKGYRAFDGNTGRALEVAPNERFEVSVTLPAGYEGNVEVKFVSPVYWHVAEMVTLITLISIPGGRIIKGLKKRKNA